MLKVKCNRTLLLLLVAGGMHSLAFGDDGGKDLVMLEASRGSMDTVHIYYNLSTGERVVTLPSVGTEQLRAGGTSGAIWSSKVSNQCVDFGFTDEYFFAIEDGNCYSMMCGSSLLDYGDVPLDTVVDCVQINWVAEHPDVDLDNDGIGDGIDGLAGVWTFWDADNGRELNQSTRMPIISFMIADLPGNLAPGGDFALTRYSVDIDLASSIEDGMVFEIGDSDSDLQGADVHNADIANGDGDMDGFLDSDLDGDGLFDWSWSVRFIQPGSQDLDGDGAIDGDWLDSFNVIGVSIGAPAGVAVENAFEEWSWEIDNSLIDAGMGQEDRFALYAPPDLDGERLYVGGFWFGGFSCAESLIEFGHTPSAMFDMQLVGPRTIDCGNADLNGDGVLDFFDVSVFLIEFGNGGDFNGDGSTNFFDVTVFLAAFMDGCS